MKPRGTNKHGVTRIRAHACAPPHITHRSNLPRIRRLSLRVSRNVFCGTPSPVLHPPHAPTLRKHAFFLQTVTVSGPDIPTSHGSCYINTVLSFTPALNLSPEHSDPGPSLKPRPQQPLVQTCVSSVLKEQLGHIWTKAPFIWSNTPGSGPSLVPRL